MEIYLKQHVTNERVLQKYADLSQKVVALQKKNSKPILAKVYPTSKACLKFTMQSMMELEMESIPELVNVIQQANGQFNWSEHVHIVVSTYRNYKNDEMRLVLRGSGFGTGELVTQKKVLVIPDEDLAFDDDAAPASAEIVEEEDATWNDEWGSFSFKKTDGLQDIATQLSRFYHDVCGSAGKKRKALKADKTTTTTTVSKKKKNIDEPIDVACEFNNDNDNNEEAGNKLNSAALVELMYFFSQSEKLSLEECVCRYNDEMNEGLKAADKVDFVSLINTDGFEQIKQLAKEIL